FKLPDKRVVAGQLVQSALHPFDARPDPAIFSCHGLETGPHRISASGSLELLERPPVGANLSPELLDPFAVARIFPPPQPFREAGEGFFPLQGFQRKLSFAQAQLAEKGASRLFEPGKLCTVPPFRLLQLEARKIAAQDRLDLGPVVTSYQIKDCVVRQRKP